ncbi:MAG: methyltransferase domain-containing protein [Micromonosporaceae bacterium]
MSEWTGRTCDACGEDELVRFADLGTVPVLCGVHWPDRSAALASPSGRMVLAYCRTCAYVRNVAFEPELLVYDASMDTNLHHSASFQRFSRELVAHLAQRFELAGKRVVDIGCGQGEFLRELCHHAGCTGAGWDAMYAGPTGPDPSGAEFHAGFAPRGGGLGRFDAFTSRHWFEHLDDPYEFLVDLREQADGRPVRGYVEVPDACYDLATAGWEVIYPHVSYFDAYSLCRIFQRAGWRVDATGTYFSGMFRWIEVSVNIPPRDGGAPLPTVADRDRQLAAIEGFAVRYRKERDQWRGIVADLADRGARPALWGAGSRSVQFLAAADPDRRLAAVVDVNPRKWGRFLPGAGHRVDPPASLAAVRPAAVIITNPAYRDEISRSLAELSVHADLLVA